MNPMRTSRKPGGTVFSMRGNDYLLRSRLRQPVQSAGPRHKDGRSLVSFIGLDAIAGGGWTGHSNLSLRQRVTRRPNSGATDLRIRMPKRAMRACVLVSLLGFGVLCGCTSVQEKNGALLNAARDGDTATAERMLRRHADINARNPYGDTPLNLAIRNEHLDTARLLVSKGADVNAKGALDDTPLHVSVYKNDSEMAGLLRSNGADEKLLNRYGLTPAEMQAIPELEAKVAETARLLSADGEWNDPPKARISYDSLKAQQDRYLVNALVLQVIRGGGMRLRVLLLAIKLGVPGSEEKLGALLMTYGDKSMAEDYLNSGSGLLHESGAAWANSHGYHLRTGPGSHRAGWGRF